MIPVGTGTTLEVSILFRKRDMDRSNVGILSEHCNQKGAKLEDKVLNVPVDLCSNSHLCSCTLSRK